VTHITVSTFKSGLLNSAGNIIFCTKKREAKVSNFFNILFSFFCIKYFYKLPRKIGNSGSGKSKTAIYPEIRDFAISMPLLSFHPNRAGSNAGIYFVWRQR